jgi:hypothetical protein
MAFLLLTITKSEPPAISARPASINKPIVTITDTTPFLTFIYNMMGLIQKNVNNYLKGFLIKEIPIYPRNNEGIGKKPCSKKQKLRLLSFNMH